ncbi:hypothetical protein BC628DRAFT_1409813 [Trametes gibbosa]|nr:hypothetical protein BC628DRAFT_1409813 [Trametes gibbosa]
MNALMSSPAELRHITSNTNLASPSRERRLSNRASQHLRTHRLGSRSPASIPSSPTSVHSSSSAIFERDIEPINSPLSLISDPHHIPRAKFTEEIERSVPSVLDSAAVVLTSKDAEDDDLDSISIVTPAPPDTAFHSGFTSPTSRLSSRSPSPTGAGNRRSLLFSNSLPGSPPRNVQGSPSTRPTVQTSPLPPSAFVSHTTVTPTPTSAYFSVPSSAASEADTGSNASSPTTATHTEHPLHSLPTHPHPHQLTSITVPAPFPSLPPSPKAASKRLSFISYADLLSSTPATTLTLSSLTSSAMVTEPPPHIPSVVGLPQAHYAASSSGGSIHGPPTFLLERDGAAGVADDVGGEWEREGLGKGLEERLEGLKTVFPSKA